jgi:hypothetical protein
MIKYAETTNFPQSLKENDQQEREKICHTVSTSLHDRLKCQSATKLTPLDFKSSAVKIQSQ